jgi:4a-hydroxytetrahydrobiopterin dehydratase
MDTSFLLLPNLKETDDALSALTLWKATIGDTHVENISRSFTARNFQSALDAINDIGQIAEREGHHPDIHLTSYREVEIVLSTHSLGGVTKNDIALAKMLDEQVRIAYSPRWLKDNPDAKPTAK